MERVSTSAKKPASQPPSRKSSSRYDHVQPVVDTGMSVNLLKKKEEEKGYVKSKDELFKRVRCSTLSQLLEEDAALLQAKEESKEPQPEQQQETLREQWQHRKFILLDTRFQEDWKKCKIIGALSYPVAMLSRSVNEFLPEMYFFKNVENKFIIVYDDDDTTAPKAATLLFQKGVDNIYLLSGGLRKFADLYPEWIEGVPPPRPNTGASGKVSRPSSTSTTGSTKTTPSVKTTSSVKTVKTAASKPRTASSQAFSL